MTPAVRLCDLVVRDGRRTLVGPVSFELARAGTLGLRGPSGSGKSTTLRALVGLLPPPLAASGTVEVLGRDVFAPGVDLPELRARAVLVGQTPVVFPASILANAAFGLRHVARISRDELRRRSEAALVEAGLWDEVADRLDAPADQLSVGQRQRLCLARALALDPELLLLDEPTSALDRAATRTVEDAITGLQGRTVLIVSHDQGQLARLCAEVVDLAHAVGSPLS
ncbi:MAG TPA: ATP-binding cassette domain-containing protein [Acidimicrobiales bacterium]|nr:ATP-binding cassette domain-containing protein [Acidimicrobiales bacterium]